MGMRQVKAPGGYILEKDENNNIRAIISPMGKKIKPTYLMNFSLISANFSLRRIKSRPISFTSFQGF